MQSLPKFKLKFSRGGIEDFEAIHRVRLTTTRHFSREHLSSDKSSPILKHLQSSERCRQSCFVDCFEILGSAPTKLQLSTYCMSGLDR